MVELPPGCCSRAEHECAGNDLDAVARGTPIVGTRVGSDDMDVVNLDVAATHFVVGEQTYRTRDAQSAHFKNSEPLHTGIVEQRTPVGRRDESEVGNDVVGGELHAICTWLENDRNSAVLAAQLLRRCKAIRS